jgi:hypothetical protein
MTIRILTDRRVKPFPPSGETAGDLDRPNEILTNASAPVKSLSAGQGTLFELIHSSTHIGLGHPATRFGFSAAAGSRRAS